MSTTYEDFPVEMFYAIFNYFQLHEIWNIFSNLNLRITAIVESIPSLSVYVGSIGMNIFHKPIYVLVLHRYVSPM